MSIYIPAGRKTPGLPWKTTLHICCRNSLMEKLSASWAIPLGKNSQNFVPCYLQISLHSVLTFGDCALLPFTINLVCEYNCKLSLASPPSASLNMGVFLESPDTLPYFEYHKKCGGLILTYVSNSPGGSLDFLSCQAVIRYSSPTVRMVSEKADWEARTLTIFQWRISSSPSPVTSVEARWKVMMRHSSIFQPRRYHWRPGGESIPA